MRGICWLAAEPVSFSRRTLLHGVSKLWVQLAYIIFISTCAWLYFNIIRNVGINMEISLQAQLISPQFPWLTQLFWFSRVALFTLIFLFLLPFILRVIQRYNIWTKCNFEMLTLLRYIAVTLFESFSCGKLSLRGVWQFEFLFKLGEKKWKLPQLLTCVSLHMKHRFPLTLWIFFWWNDLIKCCR